MARKRQQDEPFVIEQPLGLGISKPLAFLIGLLVVTPTPLSATQDQVSDNVRDNPPLISPLDSR